MVTIILYIYTLVVTGGGHRRGSNYRLLKFSGIPCVVSGYLVFSGKTLGFVNSLSLWSHDLLRHRKQLTLWAVRYSPVRKMETVSIKGGRSGWSARLIALLLIQALQSKHDLFNGASNLEYGLRLNSASGVRLITEELHPLFCGGPSFVSNKPGVWNLDSGTNVIFRLGRDETRSTPP